MVRRMKQRAKPRSKTTAPTSPGVGGAARNKPVRKMGDCEGWKADIEKIYDRINGLTGRIVDLEAQRPHMADTLQRIERSVDRLNGHIARAVWIILGLFIAAVWRMVATGSLPGV